MLGGWVYLYIFEICGELMQVVRDKIGNIWAVALTLKYCPTILAMLPSTCTAQYFNFWYFNIDCISIASWYLGFWCFNIDCIPPTQSYWSRPCYKTAVQHPSWKQTDKSSTGIPNWGRWDQRVCIGIAIITYWESHQISASQLQSLLLNASGRVWYISLYLSLHRGGLSEWSTLHWFQTEGCNGQAYENQLLCLGLNCCGLLANCCAGACFLTSCLMIAHCNTYDAFSHH